MNTSSLDKNWSLKKTSEKVKAPPPLVVEAIKNDDDLHSYLQSQLDNFTIKIISNETMKINLQNSEQYRKLS